MHTLQIPKTKPWGVTTPALRDPLLHFDKIETLCGGYCSIHLHRRKANLFHVILGRLWILEFDELLQTTKTVVLESAGAYAVPPGIWHQFWTDQETIAHEVYYGQAGFSLNVDHNDIERHHACPVGGQALTLVELYATWAVHAPRSPGV